MADAMETLKGILGDGAEDKIKNVMNTLTAGGHEQLPEAVGDSSLGYIMQIRDIMSKLANNHDDPRVQLLMSLKPYMRDGRKQSIDNAVRILSLTKLSSVLKMK